MWRWLFLFILLANAVVLLWFAVQQKAPGQGVKQEADLGRLPLLSEIDKTQLTRIDADSPTQCVRFAGFADEVSAIAVERFIQEQGFDVYREQERTVAASSELVLTVPDGLVEKMQLLDLLEQQFEQQVDEANFVYEYRLSGVRDQADANRKKQMLANQGVAAAVKVIERPIMQYTVIAVELSDRKLSKEIKEVVLESYSLQKIEKKVCEGVAKP